VQKVSRKLKTLLQTESGINASAIGERIGLSQSACWRRIQRLREEGVITDQPVVLDREKVGLTTMVFAHVKLTSHGRSNLSAFAEAVKSFPEVMDCYVLLGNVDFLLRIVARGRRYQGLRTVLFREALTAARHPGSDLEYCAIRHKTHDGSPNLGTVTVTRGQSPYLDTDPKLSSGWICLPLSSWQGPYQTG
jgi:Lrp/AsnC family transcriptional regulator